MGDRTDAAKERKGRDAVLALVRSVAKVVVARGQKVVTFDLRHALPDDETLLAHLLGPTGNLRAPTVRKGTTLLVGFSAAAYQDVLGG